MRIEVNGESIDLEEGASAHDAALAAGVEPGRGVAIALDGQVVRRAELERTPLREGQRVEVVVAIGGGSS